VDDQVEMVFQKFDICPLSQLGQATGKPQIVTGRVAPATQLLTSPVKGKHCVFYSCSAFRLEKRGENHQWICKFTEIMWCDFFLIDPNNPTVRLFVPAKTSNMKGDKTGGRRYSILLLTLL
jgi:hypothetical protein